MTGDDILKWLLYVWAFALTLYEFHQESRIDDLSRFANKFGKLTLQNSENIARLDNLWRVEAKRRMEEQEQRVKK